MTLKAQDIVHICADLHLFPTDNIDGLRIWGQDFQKGQHVVILGDLFESWIENYWSWDCRYGEVLSLFKEWNHLGIHLHLIMGNRDILAGRQLCQQTGLILHPGPLLLESAGHKLWLVHGDELLPDDISYQRFKLWVRHPVSRFLLHSLPLEILKKCAGQAREKSIKKTSQMSEGQFKINARLLMALMHQECCFDILAGHLHKNMEFTQNHEGKSVRIRILQQSHGDYVYPLIWSMGEFQRSLCCKAEK